MSDIDGEVQDFALLEVTNDFLNKWDHLVEFRLASGFVGDVDELDIFILDDSEK